MDFLQLLDGAEVLLLQGSAEIKGLDYDSRRVRRGFAFVAMRGETTDGNRYLDQAIANGAVAIVSDSAEVPPRPDVAWARVVHGRRALARLSANFYKRPAERLSGTGITGTNGKTTTAFILEAILAAARRKSALLGTVEYHLPGKVMPAPHTTPEPLELMQMLSQALAAGATEDWAWRAGTVASTRIKTNAVAERKDKNENKDRNMRKILARWPGRISTERVA